MQGISIYYPLSYLPHYFLTYVLFFFSYPPYPPYAFVLPCTAVFPVKTPVDVPLCMPIPLVEIYEHVLPFTLALTLVTTVLAEETSVHMLPGASLHVLLQSIRVCTSVCMFVRHVPSQESVIAVAVLCACLPFFLTTITVIFKYFVIPTIFKTGIPWLR